MLSSSKSMQNPTIPGRFTATSMVQVTSHVLPELLQWPAFWAHCSALAPTVDSPYSSQKDPVKYQLNQGIPLLKTLQGPLISPKRRVRISQRPHHTWHGHLPRCLPHVSPSIRCSSSPSLLTHQWAPQAQPTTASLSAFAVSSAAARSISLRLLLIFLRILIQMSMNLNNHSI